MTANLNTTVRKWCVLDYNLVFGDLSVIYFETLADASAHYKNVRIEHDANGHEDDRLVMLTRMDTRAFLHGRSSVILDPGVPRFTEHESGYQVIPPHKRITS